MAGAQVTLLIPAQPDITKPEKSDKPKAKGDPRQKDEKAPAKEVKTGNAHTDAQDGKQTAAKEPQESLSPQKEPEINEETDLLITRMDAFANTCFPMDMPQSFTVLRFDSRSARRDGVLEPERKNLLGDVEEIRYKETKAWGANVGLVAKGLYQFLMESRPFWDEGRMEFVQHYVKVMVPVYGEETGWDQAAGANFEILPLLRPFGLLSPALFSGKVLIEGRPAPNLPVTLYRINTDGQKVPTPLHQNARAITDGNGQFSFIANKTGWWCCEANVEGTPLKGPDGQPKTRRLGALLWFYVDSERENSR
ncbi:MAG: DUF4198 domain-containing protein [Desulfovibrio sp.]|nr:DUF4198 domain-containing protein [Desulfovibrio sp.]